LAALGDAEAFDGIIHTIERIGSYISKETLGDQGKHGSLERYKSPFKELIQTTGVEPITRESLGLNPTHFTRLYDMVTAARNDALHQGPFARHLTSKAIELSIILEEALNTFLYHVVADFMVRNPVITKQPKSSREITFTIITRYGPSLTRSVELSAPQSQ
jgi:hypothetical protein